jgi:serine/threonine-protein kinase
MKTSPDLESLFFAVLEKPSPEERAALLDERCAGDEELRRRVERMVASQSQAAGFLERPPFTDGPPFERSVAEAPGTTIGPYKLLEQIGEGGFGVVYMAQQLQPVRRKVALKIIIPGMDTREVVVRFEAERQALAVMDHPNIAKVLDAGPTASGRPYFVMELVHGVPITAFCDAQKLPHADRLELFIDVCRAVQHAHQKGVIHRDLKPSNVLVTMHDDRAVPKVIDFGVAKAIGEQLTEKTLYTGYGQMIGTPTYMSPEQAQLSDLDVDTRSDVYSLGVLVYELMTGTTPFDEQSLKRAGFDEMRRMIREVEPPRPSERVSTLKNDLLPTIADRRQIDPHKLGQTLRGEMDWIVMKALAKNRDRRYESPSALAADLQHFLNNEPVSAGPPSRLYRASKFVRRYKWPVIAATAVIAGLVAGVIGMAVGLASQSRQRAEARLNLAHSLQSQRKYAEAEAMFRAGLASAGSATAEDRQRLARTRLGLAKVVYDRGDSAEAERLYHEAIPAFRAAFPPGDPNIAHAITSFALLLHAQHRYADAEPLFREAYDIYRLARPADHFVIGVSARYLASALISQGKHAEAEPILRNAIDQHQLADPPDLWALAIARLEFARNLISTGKFPEAEAELIEVQRELAPTSDYRHGLFALAALYTAWDRAEPGKGYDVKAREWYGKHIETFVRLDKGPSVATEGVHTKDDQQQ